MNANVISGSNALAMLQEQHPDTWQEVIRNARTSINIACRTHKLPHNRDGYAMAIKHIYTINLGTGVAVILLAAAYTMTKRLRLTRCHSYFELSALRIQKQQAALESSDWAESEKKEFRLFYAWRLQVIEQKISGIIAESYALGKSLGKTLPLCTTKSPIRKNGNDGRNRGGIIKA